MAKLIAAQRQQQIVELLNENGGLKIAELAERFGVSKETIRRDLIRLNEAGAIQKSYGGAVSNYEFHSANVADKMVANQEIKMKICQRALGFIPENAIVYLDTGSTVTCLASLLKHRSDLTIITNSLSVVNAMLGTNCVVYMTGGELDSRNQSFGGYQTTNFLSTIKVELAFLGTTGFNQHHGPTTIGFLDAQSKQMAVQNAKKRIVLTDSSKSTSTALNQYASWKEIDCLIIDTDIDKKVLKNVRSETQVVLVDV